MFVFGHVGFGRTIIGPLRRALPIVPFIVGTLLPDAVDKPLYYSHVSGFVSCTRTFAHTGLFLAALAAAAWVLRSRVWSAIAIGVATHLVLDASMDMLSPFPSSELIALTWPVLHGRFASYDFTSPLDQLGQVWKPQIMLTEAIGLGLLAREYIVYQRTRAARDPERAKA